MADFNVGIEGAASSNVTPTQPVQDNSKAQILGGVSDIFSAATQGHAARAKAAAVADDNYAVADFSKRLITLTDSADRGIIPRSEANTKSRALLVQYLAQHPQSQENLRGAWSAIVKTTKIAEPTESEKLQNKMITDAASAGWIKSWMTDEQKVVAADNYAEFNAIAKRQDKYVSDLNMSKTEMEVNAMRRKNDAQIAIPQLGEVYFDKFNTDMQDIMMEVDNYSGPDKAKVLAEAVNRVDAQLALVNSTVNSIGAHAGGDYVNSVVAPMKELADITKKRLKGEYTTEAYKAEVDNRVARQSLQLFLNDPNTAKYVAASELMRNTPGAMIRPMEEWAVNALQDNSTEDGHNKNLISDGQLSTEKGIKQYFDVVNSGMDKLNSKSFAGDPAALKSELDAQVTNIVLGVDQYARTSKSPAAYNQLIDFFASNRFKQYSQGGGIPKDAAESAATAISQNYTEVVLPMVKDEYEMAIRGGKSGLAVRHGQAKTGKVVSEFVEPVFSGDAMTFKSRTGNPTKEQDAVIRDLNKRVAPVVNKLMRATSNLSGASAKEVYDQQIAPTVFGIQPEGSADNQLELPKYGDVINGFMYVGDKESDPRDPNNWEKAGG